MEPYRLSDKARKQLNKAALTAEKKVKQRLLIDGFDELNVLRWTDKLYETLNKQNRKKFRELFIARYLEVLILLLAKEMTEDDIEDDLVEMHLARLLNEPSDVTHYIYSTEVLRKRDRTKEAILSEPTRTQKQLMLDKHLLYWGQQTAWYLDFVSQDAEIAAMKTAGVKRVQRHEMNDGKVCAVCRDADGEIYDVDNIPELPHPACRRYFTQVN